MQLLKLFLFNSIWISIVFAKVAMLIDELCQTEIQNMLASQNVQYSCQKGVIIIQNQQTVTFSLAFTQTNLFTPINIMNIDNIQINSIYLDRVEYQMNSSFYSFISIQSCRSVIIQEIFTNFGGTSNVMLINVVQNVESLEINQMSLKQYSQFRIDVSTPGCIVLSATSIKIGIIKMKNIFQTLSIEADQIQIGEIDLHHNESFGKFFSGLLIISRQSVYLGQISTLKSIDDDSNVTFVIQVDFKPVVNTMVSFTLDMIAFDVEKLSLAALRFNYQLTVSCSNCFDQVNSSPEYRLLEVPSELVIKQIIARGREILLVNKSDFISIYNIENVTINRIDVISNISMQRLLTIKSASVATIEQINIGNQEQLTEVKTTVVMGISIINFKIDQIITKMSSISANPLIQLFTTQYIETNEIIFENGIIDTQILQVSNSNKVEITNVQIKEVWQMTDYVFSFIQLNKIILQEIELEEQKNSLELQQQSTAQGWKSYMIFVSNSTQISIYSAQINLNNFSAGFLYSLYLDSLLIANSTVANGVSNSQGGCLNLQYVNYTKHNEIQQTELILSESIFKNCRSTFFGGAIFGANITSIHDVQFNGCSSNIGGALYITNKSILTELQKIEFKNNECKVCDPDISYGVQKISVMAISQYNPYFQNTPLYLLNMINEDGIKTKEFYNGFQYVLFLKFQIGEKWYSEFNEQQFFGNMFMYLQNSGNFVNKQIQNISTPYLIYYESEDVKSLPDEIFQGFLSVTLVIQDLLSFFILKKNSDACSEGMELIQVQNSNTFICKYCEYTKVSYYQFPDEAKENVLYPSCQQCDSTMFQMCYANVSILQNNFWRVQYSINNDDIASCSIQPKNCIGGAGIGNQLCYEGHIGSQCLLCDTYGQFWNETYATYGQYQCNKCNSIQSNTIKIVFLFILFIISISFIISSNFKNIKNRIYAYYLSKMGIMYIGRSLQKKSLTSIYIKILVFNLFIYSLSNSFTQVDIISSLKELSFTLNNPLNSQLFSFSCFLIQIIPTNFSLGFANLIAYTLVPTILISIFSIVYGILLFLKKINLRYYCYSLLLTFIYLFMIVFYSSLFDLCLQSFTCIALLKSQQYLLIDLNIQCDVDSSEVGQIQRLSIPLFIIMLVVMPVSCFGYLVYRRRRLDNIKMMFSFGFLYNEYKRNYFYWEYMRFSLKVLFIIFSISFKQYTQIVGVVISIALIFYAIMLQKLLPFNLKQLNTLEITSVMISIIILLSSLMFQENNNQIKTIRFSQVSYIFAQILNLIFVFYMIFLIVTSFFENSIRKIQSKYQWLSCLKKYYPNNQMRIQSSMKKFRSCVQQIISQQVIFEERVEQELISSHNYYNQRNSSIQSVK